jgi:hypothetical protein
MATIYQLQYPNGIIEREVVGEDAQDGNEYTRQHVFPPLADGIQPLPPNPFVAWTVGPKVELIASAPFALQPLYLEFLSETNEQSEYRLYKGPPGEEVLIGSVSIDSSKFNPRRIQTETLKEGTRVTCAVAQAVQDLVPPKVKLIVREVVEES